MGQLCDRFRGRTFSAVLEKQYHHQRTRGIFCAADLYHGGLCMPQNALEVKRACKNDPAARHDDSDPCDAASEL